MNLNENISVDLTVIKQITKLQGMNTRDLLSVWDQFFDHPPEVSSREHMVSKLAYRIQELAYGGVDTETEDKIKACAKEVLKNGIKKKKTNKFSPMIGTKIIKEYHGKGMKF